MDHRGFLIMLKPFLSVIFVALSSASANAAEDPFSDFSGETSVALGFGYSENVLYSELAPVDSTFVLVSLEGFLERSLFSDAIDWSTMAFLEHRSFLSDEDIPSQTLALVQSQIEGYLGLYSQWRIGGRYLGLEQAFDATFDELERNSFLVRAEEPEFLMGWESFLLGFETDTELGLSRMSFDQEGSDYDSFNWEMDFDRRINDEFVWVSGVYGYDRSYLERSGRDLDGRAIDGSRLKLQQFGIETGLEWSGSWDTVDHTVRLLLSERRRRDGQFGYYDRERQLVELVWQAHWESTSLLFQIEYGEYRYENQFGEDDLLQNTEAFSWSLELDRKINEQWGFFLWFEEEREDSNASFTSYDARSVSLGLKWFK